MSYLMTLLSPVIAFLLAVITPFATMICYDPTVPYDKEIAVAEEKAGGYMKGICHADPDYDLLHEANIGWIRDDIPFPYDEKGNLSKSYLSWKAEMQEYADNGMKIMGITPYPDDYIEYGLDPRNPEDVKGIQDIARFYVKDLGHLLGAIQVTNEMGVDRFTYPLTMDEAYEFIGMQLEALDPVKGDILVGYNMTGTFVASMPFEMMEYHKYCDYVGVDMYLGCFENVLKNSDQIITILSFVRRVTGKPVIVCEFGYIGLGEQKTRAEKNEILQSYGYKNESEASADIDNFISKLPPELTDEFDKYADESPEYRADQMFNDEYANHLYTELQAGYGLYDFEHTPEGQAEFFSYIIPKIMDLDFVIGSFIYCWHDSGDCYVCGQAECPVETKWGLVDGNGKPKLSYYAVKEAFSEDVKPEEEKDLKTQIKEVADKAYLYAKSFLLEFGQAVDNAIASAKS